MFIPYFNVDVAHMGHTHDRSKYYRQYFSPWMALTHSLWAWFMAEKSTAKRPLFHFLYNLRNIIVHISTFLKMKFRFLKPWDPDVCDRQMEKDICEKREKRKKKWCVRILVVGSHFPNLVVCSLSRHIFYSPVFISDCRCILVVLCSSISSCLLYLFLSLLYSPSFKILP